jgi:ornithine cyclodeaminase/alanine dehydrogenase-like protein (mu-crystallin family)
LDLGAEPVGILLTMPASDADLAVVKIVSVHPGNASKAPDLSAVQAVVLVIDAHTGRRLALLDGEVVTLRRTAALSALAVQAARAHGKSSNGPVHVIGGGAQARAHLEAFFHVLGARKCTLQVRSEKAEAQLSEFARYLGYKVLPCDSKAVQEASVIVTATSSPTPVLHGPVRDDAVICAIGAFTRHMAEVSPELVQRCDVVVDTMEGSRAEAGDLIQANVDWAKVASMDTLLAGRVASDRTLLFKSVGSALWDLAAAKCWAAGAGVLRG